MARFGIWKPLASNWASRPRLTTPDIINLHTMVGSLNGTDGMWRRTGFTSSHSHFGVGGYGECWQWQDTAYQAAADYRGAHRIISVETADVGAPFAAWNLNNAGEVPSWTDAQCETLAQLIAALCKAHSIPCVLIPDSKPGRRGIGYHRLGVPGYMVAGGEQWSTAKGKACPGDRRIRQIPSIIARAQAILAGRPAAPTSPSLKEILDMQLTDPIESRIDSDVDPKTGKGKTVTVKDVLQNIQWNADRARRLAEDAVAKQVGYGNRIEDIQARNAALQALVIELTKAPGREGMTADQIEDLVEKVIAENIVKVNVSVGGSPSA
jgi:hypothetical protein